MKYTEMGLVRRCAMAVIMGVALCGAFPASASTEVVSGLTWTYNISNGKATVDGIPCSTTGDVAVPSTLGGCPVTSIKYHAFEDCSGLTSVKIPSSVTNINSGAFSGCSGLKTFVVDEDNSAYCSLNGLLCSKDGKVVISGVNGDVVIPSSVTTIGDFAFEGFGGLKSIELPGGLKSLGYSAFAHSALVAVTGGVERIGDEAFWGCTNLESVVITNGLVEIGSSAFSGAGICVKKNTRRNGSVCAPEEENDYIAIPILREVILPNGLKRIGAHAFEESGIWILDVPETVTEVNENAFGWCARDYVYTEYFDEHPMVSRSQLARMAENVVRQNRDSDSSRADLEFALGNDWEGRWQPLLSRYYQFSRDFAQLANLGAKDYYPEERIVDYSGFYVNFLGAPPAVGWWDEEGNFDWCGSYGWEFEDTSFVSWYAANGQTKGLWEKVLEPAEFDLRDFYPVVVQTPDIRSHTFNGWLWNGALALPNREDLEGVEARVALVVDEGNGKVSGGKEQAVGGEVLTLKATAASGYVFVGWFKNGKLLSQDATYAFTAPGYDVTVMARFIPVSEDELRGDEFAEWFHYEFYLGEENGIDVLGGYDSPSKMTVTVSGLPAGLTYDQTAGMITGTPEVVGEFVVTLIAKNASGRQLTQRILIVVGDEESYPWNVGYIDDLPESVSLWEKICDWEWGEDVEVNIPSDYEIEFEGLPEGVTLERRKLWLDDQWWDVLSGIPTKLDYTVVQATRKMPEGERVLVLQAPIFVPDPWTRTYEVDVDEGGTVTGAGAYRHGSTFTLTAKPKAGYVFAGWIDEETGDLVGCEDGCDCRSPVLKRVVKAATSQFYRASFITKAEDVSCEIDAPQAGAGEGEGEWFIDVGNLNDENYLTLEFEVASWSLPTITVTGLPDGLTFNGTNDCGWNGTHQTAVYRLRVDMDNPPLPGIYSVKITAKNQSGVVDVLPLTVRVANWWSMFIQINDVYGEEDGYIPGAPIEPIDFSSAVDYGVGETLTVSNLPKGMVWNPETATVTGTPSVPGAYTVTFMASVFDGWNANDEPVYRTERATATFLVGELPHLTIEMVGAGTGKVSGGGRFVANASVALKAMADTKDVEPVGEKPGMVKSVFAGWFTDAECEHPVKGVGGDYRDASFTCQMPAEREVTFYALFVPMVEDTDIGLSIGGNPVEEGAGDLEICLTGETNVVLDVESHSAPKVTVSGLPAGMKFKNGVISGKATKPGVYTVTTKLSNLSVKTAVVRRFFFRVGNLTDPEIPVGDSYGPYIPGVNYLEDLSEAEGCTVSGLPAGMKWNAKDVIDAKTKAVKAPANSVSGAPTKPGFYTVYFTKTLSERLENGKTIKVQHVATATFEVAALPVVNAVAIGQGTGTVSGIGAFAANKTISLTAKADSKDAAATAKGPATVKSVFVGWYWDEEGTCPIEEFGIDYRSPKLPYVVTPDESVTLYARFEPEAADREYTLLTYFCNSDGIREDVEDGKVSEKTVPCGVALAWTFEVDSLSLPSIKVTGLPAGLKFTTKDIVDSKTKKVLVPANTLYGTPTAASKVNAKTGEIQPSKVVMTVTTAGKTTVSYSILLTVQPIATWAQGTFNGGEEGQVTMTVAATGKISGKWLCEGLTWTFAADSFSAYDPEDGSYRATIVRKSGKAAFTNDLTIVGGELGGQVEGPFHAFQNNWKVAPWKTIAVPFGKLAPMTIVKESDMEIVIKFATSGVVTATGTFVLGTDAAEREIVYKASGTAVICPMDWEDAEAGSFHAKIFLYFPPKGNFAGVSSSFRLFWDGSSFTTY